MKYINLVTNEFIKINETSDRNAKLNNCKSRAASCEKGYRELDKKSRVK